MKETYDYDAIIIGAGISGLVCGCYLAKAGLKTLIVEKNAKPGGYCTSFTRKGFHFDACAHGLSSFRENGRMYNIFKDLNLLQRVRLTRIDPSDIFITPRHRIKIFNKLDKTIKEFQLNFPKEKENIRALFKFIALGNFSKFSTLRHLTFKSLVDSYLKDEELKAILATVILVAVGISYDKISAIVACLLYREFIFDGGYYPEGGMQAFPNLLAERFQELKGELKYLTLVKKIIMNQKVACGVVLSNNQKILARYIVSASDARQTFLNYVGQDKLTKNFLSKLNKMKPSLSYFFIYLGVRKDYVSNLDLRSNYLIMYSVIFEKILASTLSYRNSYFVITSPSSKAYKSGKDKDFSICLSASTLYREKNFWNKERREKFAKRLINFADRVLPGLSKHIVLKLTASPTTLYKWTSNFNGAGFGWASTPEQFGDPDFSQKTKIENLYLVGHWSNQSSGIPFVANSAYNAAEMVTGKEMKRK